MFGNLTSVLEVHLDKKSTKIHKELRELQRKMKKHGMILVSKWPQVPSYDEVWKNIMRWHQLFLIIVKTESENTSSGEESNNTASVKVSMRNKCSGSVESLKIKMMQNCAQKLAPLQCVTKLRKILRAQSLLWEKTCVPYCSAFWRNGYTAALFDERIKSIMTWIKKCQII